MLVRHLPVATRLFPKYALSSVRLLLCHGVDSGLWRRISDYRQSGAFLDLTFQQEIKRSSLSYGAVNTPPKKKQPVTFPHPGEGPLPHCAT